MDHYNDETYMEVEKTSDPSLKEKYWKTGFGLNQIDGLSPSNYLINELLPKHITGKLSYEEVEESLLNYYQTAVNDDKAQAEKECDLVSTRIANLLDNNGFILSPVTLKGIHRFLFKDILPDSWVGEFRQKNIKKAEPILYGDTVSYANYFMIQDTLQYDFDIEKKKNYVSMDGQNLVKSISEFASSIWQVHPFREGNTRTVAVFLVQYLNSKGFNLNNQPFEENALYFRNALVKANYSNREKLVEHTNKYLNRFFENLLLGSDHILENEEMIFDDKQDANDWELEI